MFCSHGTVTHPVLNTDCFDKIPGNPATTEFKCQYYLLSPLIRNRRFHNWTLMPICSFLWIESLKIMQL